MGIHIYDSQSLFGMHSYAQPTLIISLTQVLSNIVNEMLLLLFLQFFPRRLHTNGFLPVFSGFEYLNYFL